MGRSAILVVTCLILVHCWSPKVWAFESTDEVYHGLTASARAVKQHPRVGDSAWFLNFLECSTCHSIYQSLAALVDKYFAVTDEHKLL